MLIKVPIFITSVLLTVSCTDNYHSRMLIGSWLVVTTNQQNTILLKETYIFNTDKSFTINIEQTENNMTKKYSVSGKYYIDGNILNYEALESNHPYVPKGQKDWNEILKIDENTSVTKSSKGEIVTAKRIN